MAGAALISAALAACGAAVATSVAPAARTAAHPAVVAAAPARCTRPAPTTAAGYTAALAAVPTSQWGGADLSVSVPMPDGRIVWLYGDTLSGPTVDRFARFVHSTAIVQDRGCFHVSAAGAQVLPNDSAKRISWPSSGIALDGSHLLVASGQMQLTGACAFCFSHTGIRGAILTLSPAGDVTFSSWLPRWPSLAGKVVWGAGMAKSGNQVAMYGISGSGLGRDLYVATATLAGARGGQWTLDGTPVAHAVDPAGVTPYHDGSGWHIVTKRGDTIVALNSSDPAGQFTERAIGTVHASERGHLYYMAAAHPELALAGGKLMVTVCSNWVDGKTHSLPAYRPIYLALTR
jgi:hypothetical protein